MLNYIFMARSSKTKRGRSQDRKRVSMQKHEIRYSRKLCKKYLKSFKEKKKITLNKSQVARICKHFIKISKKK